MNTTINHTRQEVWIPLMKVPPLVCRRAVSTDLRTVTSDVRAPTRNAPCFNPRNQKDPQLASEPSLYRHIGSGCQAAQFGARARTVLGTAIAGDSLSSGSHQPPAE
jgi:hypothetical protein